MNAVIKTPVAIVTQADMDEWFTTTKQLEALKARELELRKKIFNYNFTQPTEGVNSVPLSAGWVLKGEYRINRTVDAPLLANHLADFRKKKIPVDALIRYKPEVVTAEYRKLDEKQRKEFDAVLKISEGTPGLEIVLPKRAAPTPVA